MQFPFYQSGVVVVVGVVVFVVVFFVLFLLRIVFASFYTSNSLCDRA